MSLLLNGQIFYQIFVDRTFRACWTKQRTILDSFAASDVFLSATETQITGNQKEATKKGFVPKGRDLET